MRCTVLALLLAAAAASCSPASSPPPAPSGAFPAGELVDLSHTFDQSTIVWPTSATFRLEKVSEGVTPAGFFYAANNLFTAEHGGTHIDAPVHFAQGRPAVDGIPLERLVGGAVVVDVTPQADADADYQVTVADIEQAERRDGRIPDGAIMLLRTGFSTRWPDAARYLGTAERGEGGVARLHFPGLHPDAARWLVANRRLAAIGIDTASIDYGQSMQYESHRTLFERDIPAFENLTALERLPPRGAQVIALPMKVGGGSGAPLRAIAILPSAGS
jgi:kynurenine formamidase